MFKDTLENAKKANILALPTPKSLSYQGKNWKRSLVISCLKKKLYRANGGHISDPVKYKKYKKDEKLRKWSAKKTKKMPKWQVLNQLAKILPLQTTQLQIVVRPFLANTLS